MLVILVKYNYKTLQLLQFKLLIPSIYIDSELDRFAMRSISFCK